MNVIYGCKVLKNKYLEPYDAETVKTPKRTK